MRKLEGDDRATEYKLMGGTNTPYRRRWQAQMREGRTDGWYRAIAGTVAEMRLENEMIASRVMTSEGPVEVAAEFVIDCTGLEADIAEPRLLADLLWHSGAGRNPLGRLDGDRNFELAGAKYRDAFLVLATVTVLGIGWECLYHLLMQWRWEKDWPTLFGLVTLVPEGLLVWLLLAAKAVPGIVGTVTAPAFCIQFLAVWLSVWLVAHGPVRVPVRRRPVPGR